jgi:hypothetical protein
LGHQGERSEEVIQFRVGHGKRTSRPVSMACGCPMKNVLRDVLTKIVLSY